jgi:hypothetical protein
MSTIALALLIAGLAFIIGEILVKDPELLLEVAGTRDFALAQPAHRAPAGAHAFPSNSNERPAPGKAAA